MKVTVEFLNYSYVKVDCENGVFMELRNYFCFDVDGAKFNPKFKYSGWDGKIRLLESDGRLPIGLVGILEKYCAENDLEIEVDERLAPIHHMSREEFDTWLSGFEIYSGDTKITPHWYQADSVFEAINGNRRTLNLPTSAGKSLIACLLARWYLENYEGKILILVPTTALVQQMIDDFADYRLIPANMCHGIMSGTKKHTDRPVVVSTWQSACKMPSDWFDQFGFVNVDECFHGDTIIKTPLGAKKIKDLNQGDPIYSMNEDTGEIIEDVIVKVHTNMMISSNEKMYELEMDDGSILKVTGNHKFMTKNRGWVRADELAEDDDIIEFHTKYRNSTGRHLSQAAKKDGFADKILSLFPYADGFADAHDIFLNGERECQWCGARCRRYHKTCSLSCAAKYTYTHTDALERMSKTKKVSNKPAWNKGMKMDPSTHPSRKNPERWAEISAQFSKDRMGAGNPFYGKNHTDDTKTKHSEHIKSKILDGSFTPNTTNRLTHGTLKMDGINYRSKWEMIYHLVYPELKFEKVRIGYEWPDGSKHVYIADFHDDVNKKLFEIKPSNLVDDWKVKLKSESAHEWCIDNGYEFIIVDENVIMDVYYENKHKFSAEVMEIIGW